VDTVTLYVVLRADQAWDAAALALVADALGPAAEDLRMWADGDERSLLRISGDRPAQSLSAALDLGHALAADVVGLAPVPARVVEVSAMTDEDVMVWRSEP
jgi:hypothetical protein